MSKINVLIELLDGVINEVSAFSDSAKAKEIHLTKCQEFNLNPEEPCNDEHEVYLHTVDVINERKDIWIENEIWEPNPEKPGYVTYKGQRKVKEIYKELSEHLKSVNLYPDEYFLDDFYNNSETLFPKSTSIISYPVTGSSEGHYIHVMVRTVEGKCINLFTGKTWGGFDKAAEIANECARVLGA